jgi:DNA-binding NarL/FixJ family response regulator
MGLDPNSRAWFNLGEASILLMDETPLGLSILGQMLAGFGGRNLHRTSSVAEAKEAAVAHVIDLAIVNGGPEGYEFVEWLRRHGGDPNAYVPVLLTAGHTAASMVHRARDCGAHFTLKKPLAPITLLERIIWAAKASRVFLMSDLYVGPDRRFRTDPPPGGVGRRYEDRLAAAAPAQETPD